MEKTNRGLVLLSAAVTGGLTGYIYLWSIFKNPLMEARGWTSNEVTMAYTLYLLFALIGIVANGPLIQRGKPRLLVFIAGVGAAGGWILTSFSTSLTWLYVSFGFITSIFSGVIFGIATTTATLWFPDKRGFANGVCIGGLGLASVIFAPLGNYLIATFDVFMAFRICGLIFLVLFVIFSQFLTCPPEGWKPEGWVETQNKVIVTAGDVPTKQMLKMTVFWLTWLIMMVQAISGLMITGHASSIGQQQVGLTAAEGALMISLTGIAQFTGRLGFGTISDKIGRYKSLYIILGLLFVDMMFVMGQARSSGVFIAAVLVVTLCFGGAMTTLPSLCSDLFGIKYYAKNWPFVYSGYTVASLVGPMVASEILTRTGSYQLAFYLAGALAACGLVLVTMLKRWALKPEGQ